MMKINSLFLLFYSAIKRMLFYIHVYIYIDFKQSYMCSAVLYIFFRASFFSSRGLPDQFCDFIKHDGWLLVVGI